MSELVDTNPKTRFGATKPSVALIPSAGVLHEALAFEDGALKYGAYNWRKNSVSAMTYAHAMIRHILDWIDRIEDSSDAGAHNLGHTKACASILLDSQALQNLVDDRPIAGASADLAEAMCNWKKAIVAAEEQSGLPAEDRRGRRAYAVRVVGGVSAWLGRKGTDPATVGNGR